MAKETKDTTIGELLEMNQGVIPILMSAGMHCVGCPSSAMETLEQACEVHGMDFAPLLEELNKLIG
jgi:hybrid cluster-associated redox disulfide protein